MKRAERTMGQKRSRRRGAKEQVRPRLARGRKDASSRKRNRRMTPLLKRLLWIVTVALLVFGVLLYPFESPVVPAWSVQVVDESDRPVAGIDVQQEWGQFGADDMIWADSRITGADGRVDFPERVVEAPLGPRALKYFLTSGIEPIPGENKQVPSSHLFVCRQGKAGEVSWEQGRGQPQGRMMLHKGFCQYSRQGT